MKVAIYLIFIFLVFTSLFIVPSKNSLNKILKVSLLSLGILIFCAMISSAFIDIKNDDINSNIFFVIYVSCMIVIAISIANQLSHMIVNYIVYFHEQNNHENINRNPIKFLIEKRNLIKKIFTIIWFLGSLIMLSGIWFARK